MSHILVKWVTAEAWDVYPTRFMTDVATATQIMSDPSIVETLVGRTYQVAWKTGEPPADAYLVAAGEEKKLERKRNRLASRASAHNTTQHSSCCTHLDQLKEAEKENSRLKRKLEEQQDLYDLQKTVRTLKRVIRDLKGVGETTVSELNMVDIGHGVAVSKATLTRLEETYKDSACKFARSLMRVVFTDEEMINKSLFGKQANSHKEREVKPALDSRRVNAVLGMFAFYLGL
ncbi:uncharacterized protein LOC135389474 [Ornithodoros turicata]|uniref:uncharacterized protein LOC135389474 n=1 Tax=Ornithodoros turicata TaxID=34597 RepID=UPI00313987DC